ncbi:MAG: HupE/UreJ family protein [Janthinobacterium lividum]
MRSNRLTPILAAVFCGIASPVLAHTEVGVPGGLLSGALHPLTGADHLVAMVAVGLWGAQLGRPAIWILPIAFPVVMAFGAVLGMAGTPVPQPELMIALSALVLGLLVAFAVRANLWAAALVVSVFAIFHGYAHGQELPEAANPLAYGLGFVVATGTLHAIGIGIGTLTRWEAGRRAVQGLGLGVAGLGVFFLASVLR